ncbi:MAG: thioesterase family protein, partial [Bacteroidetes bacterium]|nr:thioesterase family protein [Bacteroidota bacterium]
MKSKYEIEVRFRDIDAMGHVNNAVYLSYFEQARIGFFNAIVDDKWDWNKLGVL